MRKQVSSQWLIRLLRRLFHPSDTLFVRFPSVKVVRGHSTRPVEIALSATTNRTRDALNVRLSKILQQRTSVLWHNWLQPGQSSGHVSDWQKGYSLQHTNEMAELIVVFIFCSQTQWLNFSPCRLQGQVVETIIPILQRSTSIQVTRVTSWQLQENVKTTKNGYQYPSCTLSLG